MDRIQLKMSAKESIRGKWGPLALVSMILAVACGGFSFAIQYADTRFFMIIPTFSISVLLGSALSVGVAKMYLDFSSGKEWNFKEILLYGFKNNYTQIILWNILRSVFIFLWSLLLIVPGIIKAYSYAMSPYIMAENTEIEGKVALQESEKLMRGHKGELLVFDLSFIGWFILGCLTFGILFVYVVPYYEVSKARFYENIKIERTNATIF